MMLIWVWLYAQNLYFFIGKNSFYRGICSKLYSNPTISGNTHAPATICLTSCNNFIL